MSLSVYTSIHLFFFLTHRLWNLPFQSLPSLFCCSSLPLCFHFCVCHPLSIIHSFHVFLSLSSLTPFCLTISLSLYCGCSRLCDQSWGHVLSLDTLQRSARLHKTPQYSLYLAHIRTLTQTRTSTQTWISKYASDWHGLNMCAFNTSFSNALRSCKMYAHITLPTDTHTNTHTTWTWRRARISFSLCLSLGEPPGQHTALDVPELEAVEDKHAHTDTDRHTHTHTHKQMPSFALSVSSLQRFTVWEL